MLIIFEKYKLYNIWCDYYILKESYSSYEHVLYQFIPPNDAYLKFHAWHIH